MKLVWARGGDVGGGMALCMCDSGTVYSALKAFFLLFATGLSIVGQTATVLGWGTVNDQGVFATSLRGVEVCSLIGSKPKIFYNLRPPSFPDCTVDFSGGWIYKYTSVSKSKSHTESAKPPFSFQLRCKFELMPYIQVLLCRGRAKMNPS
jgi:hypothetical protein